MRVLVTGAKGQVGHELLRTAPHSFEVHGFDSSQLDITDNNKVQQTVDALRPDLIINAAAYTAVDKAESDSEQAWAVNRDAVGYLSSAASRLDIPLFHISTDYVFTGDSLTPYRESEPTGPTGVYGASKLAGEQTLAANCSKHITLRTSWVFGAHGNNFVKTMLRLGKERDSLSIVADQRGGPTSAASIAAALWRLAERYSADGRLDWGIYHYSGLPDCTWFDFANEIFAQATDQNLISQKPTLSPISTADYPTPARRPAWSVMDCSKLQSTFGISAPDWRQDLQTALLELAGG
ncbi:dTDP-4-dehydrorhamnose reductase [Halopseudomonas pachastrellae]|nr:dTDP-4-dehydrorhamnose reductase [Halopseudomonas pachastrellae]